MWVIAFFQGKGAAQGEREDPRRGAAEAGVGPSAQLGVWGLGFRVKAKELKENEKILAEERRKLEMARRQKADQEEARAKRRRR